MLARHGGWAAARARLVFTAGPPLSKGSQPCGVPRPPACHGGPGQSTDGLLGVPRPLRHRWPHAVNKGPLHPGYLQTPGSSPSSPRSQTPAPHRALGKGLAPRHRVFPISVPSILPTTNPSTFLLSIELKPHSHKDLRSGYIHNRGCPSEAVWGLAPGR